MDFAPRLIIRLFRCNRSPVFDNLIANSPHRWEPLDCSSHTPPPFWCDKPMTDPIPFEEALGELQQIVSSLETGQVSLEQSLAQFERGVSLVSHCKSLLDQAHQRVEIVVSRQASGAVETAPFDVSATFDAEQATNSGADSPTVPPKAKRRKPELDQRGLFN